MMARLSNIRALGRYKNSVTGIEYNIKKGTDSLFYLYRGRYLPPKSTMEQMQAAFGFRVGLPDNWEEIYDQLMPETKEEQVA